MLITWQELRGNAGVGYVREVTREQAPTVLTLLHNDPKVLTSSVRLWREAKIRTRVRVEVTLEQHVAWLPPVKMTPTKREGQSTRPNVLQSEE